jgi:hypothetical protein
MYFVSKQSTALKPGPASVPVSIDMVPSDYAKLKIGFTRSYVSSQAYFEQFHNAEIRQLPKTLDFDTSKFGAQYSFLGYTARKLLFDFLAECKQPGVRLDVFAYDFDEPDVLQALVDLGPRLRIWLDDAPLHNAQGQLRRRTEGSTESGPPRNVPRIPRRSSNGAIPFLRRPFTTGCSSLRARPTSSAATSVASPTTR